ncbi:hypothetical protein C7S15_5897 [Burkholderia cepacia]|uniref:hypothetical protein n=1 Tax=Burkholderia cepacia TaxID=292 RepID=UPI00298F6146|nr:hypothetical protein [Burkholderia cepacia]MDW9232020.1 hypothetical protein [Burkholderia cepacia]
MNEFATFENLSLSDYINLPRANFDPAGYAKITSDLRSIGYEPIDGTSEYLIWSKPEGDRIRAEKEASRKAQEEKERLEDEEFRKTPRGQFETEFEILLDKYGFSQIWDLAYCVYFNE